MHGQLVMFDIKIKEKDLEDELRKLGYIT